MYENEVHEVRENKEGNAVQDAYAEAWRERYYENPSLSAADRTLFRDLARQLGVAKACAAVRQYVSMNLPYFLERAHTPAVLKTSLNAVLAAHGASAHATESSRSLRIQTLVLCDTCPPDRQNFVPFNGSTSELMGGRKRICKTCQDEYRKPAGLADKPATKRGTNLLHARGMQDFVAQQLEASEADDIPDEPPF